MLVVLALHGCGSLGDPPATTEVKEVVGVDEPAGLRIATAPDHGVVARAPVIETPLPSGAPIVRMRECFGYGWDDDALDQLGYVGPSTGRGGGGLSTPRPSPGPAAGQKG